MADDELSELEYFQAIEARFLLHRGSPLLLSPSDYRVAQGWRRAGVPLDVVLRTIDEYFERQRARAAPDEPPKVWGLRQVRRSVETAWKLLRELTAPGDRDAPEAAPALDLEARLRRLVEALPGALPDREGVARRLESLLGETDPRRVEEALGAVEESVLSGCVAALDGEERRALEAEVERVMAPLVDRMTHAEAEAARVRLLHQKLRRRVGMPTLSLFADV